MFENKTDEQLPNTVREQSLESKSSKPQHKKRIIIDATYDKGIRVASLVGNELENLDFEVKDRAQIRGNIYLAKVIRIEQSLQAAFVDFGVGKNGFLPFSEIHPDYYQISSDDKADIIRQMKSDYDEPFKNDSDDRDSKDSGDDSEGGLTNSVRDSITQESSYDLKKFESIIRNKKYKISDVLKKDQLVLIQVLKEERGNKGATLTTYISLAGKYLVFMPNSLKGNGISRKIEMPEDRKRIRNLISSFAIPVTASIVARTAAQEANDEDLQKDSEYLLSLWNSIRDKTLKSEAPSFVHEEDNILRRVVRDYCDQRTTEIVIEGVVAYDQVREYAQTLSINTVKIIDYFGKTTAFSKYGVESKIDALFSPRADLPSGAYLIIQQTEALVSIDVNSGRATGEQTIEETALKTNLEAVEEIVRQIRLRNLSGIIVVDFIDMMRFANKKTIERAMKNAISKDKVRVQVGRISQFGLLEISRQRTRPSFIETAGVPCQHCKSTGFVKSLEYTASSMLRTIDSNIRDELMRSAGDVDSIHINTTTDIGGYVLNYKRQSLNAMEQAYGIKIFINSGRSQKDEDFWIVFESKKQNLNEFRNSNDHKKSDDTFNLSGTNTDVIETYNDKGMHLKKPDIQKWQEGDKEKINITKFAIAPFKTILKIVFLPLKIFKIFKVTKSSKSTQKSNSKSKYSNYHSNSNRNKRGGDRRKNYR